MTEVTENARDPVCGKVLEKLDTPHITDFEGERYFFCSEGCKSQFDADPKAFQKMVAA